MSQENQQALIQRATQQRKAVNDARNYKEPGFSFTRRIIALASIASVVVIPIVAAVFNPELPVSYGFSESQGGFMFFTDARDTMSWATGTGIIIGPLHSHLVYAIAGLYFGASSVK